ncbi:MAG TPA: NYN domain-containing protein, partial [Candidatus Paceibacterota bacterium]|nr:NYN domain-containing protein [Candidatus Paceibacterota bacterium]
MTVPQRKHHRVGVFVDVSNMYHSAKNLYRSRVNFRELLKLVTANRQLVRAVAYVIKSDTEEEKAFFSALEKAGYELKSKDLQVFPGGMKKGDWDVAIAIDAITLSKQLDVVVIVSGDGDYEPLVDYL